MKFFWSTFSVMSVSLQVLAQSADTMVVERNVAEVVVAGVKTNRHNITPASVSVVGPALLRTQRIAEVAELSGVLPNLFVADYGSKQTTPIAIRGIMTKQKGSAVGFYVDGVPHFEVSSFDSDLFDVKAIEVYRGPQGTLYGRNTLGGVVNIYTHTPFEGTGLKVRVEGGNYRRASLQAVGRFLPREDVGLSVGGYYKHLGGYFSNSYLHQQADASNECGAKAGLFWKPSDRMEVRLSSAVDYVDQGGYPYAPYDVASGQLSPVAYDRACGFSRLLSTSGLCFSYTTDNVSVVSQSSFQYLDELMKMDQDFTPVNNYFTTLDVLQTAMSEEVTVKSNNFSRVQWVAGLFAFRQVRNNTSDTEYAQRGYRLVNDYEMPTSGVAIYAQLSANVWRGLALTVGLRTDHEKSSDDYVARKVTGDVETPQKSFVSSLRTNDFLPKVGVQYKWAADRNVAFANVTRGCKAGGFNSVFESDDERTFDDESAWNYELGLKATSALRKRGLDVALFAIDWRRQHVNRTVPGLGVVVCNAGHSVSKGVEASAWMRPVVGLLLQVNYGYTYAKFLTYKKSDSQDFSGNMLPMVPRNTVAAMASYTLVPKRGLDMLTMSLNVNGVGKLYWLEDNEVVQPFYAQLTAKMSLQKGPVTVDLWGKNLTRTHYLSYYMASSAKFAQDGLPTTWGASLSLSLF